MNSKKAIVAIVIEQATKFKSYWTKTPLLGFSTGQNDGLLGQWPSSRSKVQVVPYTFVRREVPVGEDTYPEPSACEVGWPVPYLPCATAGYPFAAG